MADLDPFFTKVTAARSRVLFLDYDGTLAPFRVERDQAFPYPGVREVLAEIQATKKTRLVVVSGRPVTEVIPLLALPTTPEIWGSHGWERQPATQSRAAASTENPLVQLPPKAQEALAQGWNWLIQNDLTSRSERKPASLAVHWRGQSPDKVAQIRDTVGQGWQSLIAPDSLELLEFDGGLELRVRGRNKGVAVRTVLSEEGEDVVAAYLGDDRTDEDAFVAIERRGLGVLVRDQYRPTAASHWLRPPEELLDFLIRWANARQSVVGNTENNKENNAETNNENNAKNNAQNDTPPEPRTGR